MRGLAMLEDVSVVLKISRLVALLNFQNIVLVRASFDSAKLRASIYTITLHWGRKSTNLEELNVECPGEECVLRLKRRNEKLRVRDSLNFGKASRYQ